MLKALMPTRPQSPVGLVLFNPPTDLEGKGTTSVKPFLWQIGYKCFVLETVEFSCFWYCFLCLFFAVLLVFNTIEEFDFLYSLIVLLR